MQPFAPPRQHGKESATGSADEDDEDGSNSQIHVVMLDSVAAAVVELDGSVKRMVVVGVHFFLACSSSVQVQRWLRVMGLKRRGSTLEGAAEREEAEGAAAVGNGATAAGQRSRG